MGNKCKFSVDGIACLLERSFKGMYSHKHKRAAFCYKIGVCIQTVWIYRPFLCSNWPDLKIFRNALKHGLLCCECIEADNGYKAKDPKCMRAPGYAKFLDNKHRQKRIIRLENSMRPLINKSSSTKY